MELTRCSLTPEAAFQGHTVGVARAGIIAQGILACAQTFCLRYSRQHGTRRVGVGMYLDFYRLKSAPFQSTPNPTFLFLSASHKAALDAMAAGIATRHGLVTITGAKGVGKTTLVQAYLARIAPPQPRAARVT